MLPRVVLAEPAPRFDLSAAARHGDLVFLSSDIMNPFTTDGMVNIFRHRLKEIDFNPDKDFLCMTGSNLTVGVMMATAARMYPTLKVLMFHAPTSDYRARIVS